MKKGNKILLVSAVGFIAVTGFLILKKWMEQEDSCYYTDFHKLLANPADEDRHGIEFFAMQ